MLLHSPAKLNLTFRVLQKRPDGFHEIESLYQAIDLCDQLEITPAPEETLTCTDPRIPTDQSNLILRAAALFREKTNQTQTFSFHLEKNIPIEAGLGGGSGNAATTLWGLNQLLDTQIDDATLAKWAREIGSDISFFFSSGTAKCTGRGEQIETLESALPQTLWIAKPPEGLSTPSVYQALDLKQLPQNRNGYFNDLEVPAFALMPSLQKLKESLCSLGFDQVHMTGSGTAFFCLGNVVEPCLKDIIFYRTKFLSRSPNKWY